ncbi:MAG: DNA replication/repair protein RecF [Rickettsiales bacterium]
MSDVFQSSLKSIELQNFRNHKAIQFLDLGTEPVVITGKNGVGKTNILEAISLLTASKGLRGAKISDLNNQEDFEVIWKIKAQTRSIFGLKEIVTQRKVNINGRADSRIVQIDGQLIKKKAELNDLLRVVWLTPPMQQLFINASSERRSFFDQITTNFFPSHVTYLSKYEQSTRDRLRLLKQQNNDDYWLSALESNMFNAGKEVCAARENTLALLVKAIEENQSPFPKAIISLSDSTMADNFLDLIKRNRGLDAASGRTNLGPHSFDLNVIFKNKNMPAKLCSTGEQKALLLNLILAQVYALIDKFQTIPILLFDEIISHLDSVNRKSLLDEIMLIKAQSWFTGLDPKSFSQIDNAAKFVHLE